MPDLVQQVKYLFRRLRSGVDSAPGISNIGHNAEMIVDTEN